MYNLHKVNNIHQIQGKYQTLSQKETSHIQKTVDTPIQTTFIVDILATL